MSRLPLTHFWTARRENKSTILSTVDISYPMVAAKIVVYRDESSAFRQWLHHLLPSASRTSNPCFTELNDISVHRHAKTFHSVHGEADKYAKNNGLEAEDELHHSSVGHSRSNRARYPSAGHWSSDPMATTAASSSISYVCAETRKRKCTDLDKKREEKEEDIQFESSVIDKQGMSRHVETDYCTDVDKS
jgi:hypothetical protein